ncbi:hypothetical protein V6N13_139927 [Hibiscus sabdariffa]
MGCSVADMALSNGEWKWHLFEHILPRDIVLRIAAIKGPLSMFAADSVGWKLSSSNQFSLRSAYEVHMGNSSSVPSKLWRNIHSY